jgi:GTP-binding protein
MAVPVVAIVGRPNVGKSSLFNWLAGRRIAIVDSTAGVTRDRVSTPVTLGDRAVELMDTGGIGIEDADNLTADVERQIRLAIEQAQVILFVVDIRAGVVPLDDDVSRRLHETGKPVVLVANKCDTPELEAHAAEFFRLGFDPVLPVSAMHNRGRDRLAELVEERLPPAVDEAAPEEPALKLAIVGRRNTGKSTFINCLAQSERMIVSEVPGTTRDSVDVYFRRDGRTFVAIDTAGVRRKKSLHSDVEFYSLARAERSIRRADVVLLFFDAAQKISKVDKQLAEYILEQNKPAVFVVNKWDLMAPMPTGKMGDYLQATFPSLDHVPVAFTTAKTGRNVQAVLNLAQALHKQAGARVGTGDLNRVLRQALEASPPPTRQNRRPRVYYATQTATHPPTVVLFTNGAALLDNTYLRYLLKTFRDQLPFHEVPIKLLVRTRQRGGEEGPPPGQSPAAPKRTRARKGRKGEARSAESELWTDI